MPLVHAYTPIRKETDDFRLLSRRAARLKERGVSEEDAAADEEESPGLRKERRRLKKEKKAAAAQRFVGVKRISL